MQMITIKSHFRNILAKRVNRILASGDQIVNFSVVHFGSYYVGFFEIVQH